MEDDNLDTPAETTPTAAPLSTEAAPEVTDPTTGIPVPPVDIPQGIGSLGNTLAQVYDIPVTGESKPALVDMEPGHADRVASAAAMQPGHADLYPNEQSQEQTVIRPGTPGGMQLQGETIEKVPDAAAKGLMAQQETAGNAATSAGDAATAGQQKYADYVNEQAQKQYQDAQAHDLAIAAATARNNQVIARVQDKMDSVAAFKPDREQMFEGTAGGFRALGAVVGMLFGGALSGLNGGPNQAQEAVFHMIDQNVKEQVRQNSAVYDQLKVRLGDAQAAQEALRQKHLEYAKQMLDSQALGRQGQALQAGLAGAKERVNLEIQNSKLALMEKLVPHEKLALAHVAPTPTQILTLDKQETMLREHGMTPETRQKFLLQKVDEKNSVGDLIENVKTENRDINMLKSIKDEYGGKLPGPGQAIDWDRSHVLRALGARLGFKKAVDASQVYAKIEQAALERAKSYGRVTEYEVDSAKKQMGETPDQIIQFMQDSADHANHKLATVANAYSGGHGQAIIDILSAGIAGTPGIRTAGVTPR